MKRVISVILTVMLMFTSLPIGLFAGNDGVKTTVNVAPDNTVDNAGANRGTTVVLPENKTDLITATSDDLVYGEESVITRAQWLHNLAVVFEMTVETMAAPDNYFSDLSEDHPYYTDIILNISFGVVDIEAGEPVYPDEALTREFAASTLNFCLGYSLEENTALSFADTEAVVDAVSAQISLDRGWFGLVDGCFSPELAVTNTEVEIMLDDAKSIIEATVIDENTVDTFEFAEGVVVVPIGTAVSADENGVVSITDSPVTISVGDSFAVFYNDIPVIYSALAVEINNNVTVISTQSVAAEEFITSIDAQGKAYDMEFIPAEGVEMNISEKTDGLAKANGTKPLKTIDLSGDFEILDGIEISLSVTLDNPEISYKVNEDYGYVALVSDAEISYGVTCDPLAAKGKDSVTLLKVNVGGVGSFTVEVEVELSGSINGYVTGVLTAGLEYTKQSGLREVKSFYQTGSGCNADLTGAIGLKASLGVTELPFVSAYVYIRMGIKANVKVSSWTFGEESGTCVSFNGYLYGEYGGYASVDLGKVEFSFNPKVEFYHAGNSPVRIVHHYEDDIEVAACTQGNGSSSYYTNSDSAYGGSGWNGCNGAYAVDSLGFQVPLYEYTVDTNNNVIITKFLKNYYTVNLPSNIDGKPVISVGAYAFEEKGLAKLHIPTSVTRIENRAFENCGGIKALTIPNSVTMIYTSAFDGCTSLKEISIPASVKQIDSRAFANTAITKIEIPKTLEKGGANGADSPFADCQYLKEVIFEDGITKIPQNIFSHCDSLEEIKIPDTVTTVENHAFNGCENLKYVNFSDSLAVIEPYAFMNCKSLEYVELPNSLTEIQNEAFRGCTGLTKMDFPDNVTYIAQEAFADCENLTSLKLPANLVQLSERTFANIPITEIQIPKSLDKCIATVNWGPFTDCENLKKVTFEDGTETVAEKLFAGCVSLEEITIPDSVTTIEWLAFWHCSNLKKVHIPESVTEIQGNAFQQCTALTEIDLPEAISAIQRETFRGCTALKSIDIPDSVTDIAYRAFYNCSSLTKVDLPESLTYIGESAFMGTALTGIEIPKALNSTGGSVFYGCETLKSVTFEEGTGKVAYKLFQYCQGVEEIIIPDTVTTIEGLAFSNCGNLKKIVIPDSTTYISYDAFKNSPNVSIEGYSGSYAQTFAQNNGINFVDLTPFHITSVNNYTVTIDGIEDIKEIRYAIGHYTTGADVKAAEKNQTLSAALVAKYTVDGVMTYEVPWVGEYTFWVRTNDGSGYFLYCDVNEINPYLESDGLRLTVKDFGENYKDMWIAEGTWSSYSEIKNNATVKYQAAATKLSNYFANHDFTYTTANPGDHTVLIRYNDGTQDVIHTNLTVDVPTFDVNGLQVTVGNLGGVKVIRTAYGEYNSIAEIKTAKGLRCFNNKTTIKDAESYKIQYRENTTVTIIVEYYNGYKHVEHVDISKKVPAVVQKGNSISIGDLDGLVIVRYAPGIWKSYNGVKNAQGSRYIKPSDIIDGYISINDLPSGDWTLCVRYDDESENLYHIVVE